MSAPEKFIKSPSGVRMLNPAFKAWQASQGQLTSVAPALVNAATALPVICSAAEQRRHLIGSKPAESAGASADMMQDADIAAQVGLDPSQAMANLARVFAKYEVPMGLLNKLLGLSDFEFAEMIVDDSGSMNKLTDSKDAQGRDMTRWQEVHTRIVQMFEILAYVPAPPIYVRFLNRADIIECKHAPGEKPEVFLQRVLATLQKAWAVGPAGTTPAKERIAESLARCPGKAMLRYFFGDGAPNGGKSSCHEITQMLIHRPNPEKSPFSFISCTNEDDQVEWMKECEEAAPFCSEFDDFVDEAREVLKDQGKAFPYTFGMHLVCQLVAAFNPDDLDALDESVPLTKQTLDNLQGYQCSPQEYDYYFGAFLEAQATHPAETVLDKFKKDYQNVWRQNVEHFRQAPIARMIPFVQQYHAKINEAKRRGA